MGDVRMPNDIARCSSLPTSPLESKSSPMSNVNDLMRFEDKRRETFHNWPESAPVEANKLAKAGFYYLGTGLSVMCFSCGGTIDDWDFGNKAIVRHKRLNPQCDFILNKSNNVSLVAREGSISSSPSSLQPLSNGSSADANPISLQIRNQSSAAALQQNESYMRIEPETTDQKTWQSFNALLGEAERRKTFKGWPVPFISCNDLARSGFFFLRDRDRVQCVFCNGIVGDWEHGDVPVTEHHRHFPNCPFLKGFDVGNIPLTENETSRAPSGYDCLSPGRPGPPEDVTGSRWQHQLSMYNVPERGRNSAPVRGTSDGRLEIIRHTGPRHPNYATIEARMRTYLNWPPSIPQKPDELATAGFYYAGISDHVRCFYCDGGLRNWEPEDDPWMEHARWFGNCSFLLLVKGHDFANRARLSRPPVLPENHTSSVPQLSPIEQPSHPLSHQPIEQPSHRLSHQQHVSVMMSSSLVLAVINAGMPLDIIREALEKRLQQTSVPFRNADELYDACVVTENGVQQRYPSESLEESTSGASYNPPTAQPPSTVCNGTIHEPSPTTELEKKTKELALEEMNSLKESRVCKICMDEELGVVFLPCGHLIACVKCAPSLTDCPYCRKPIRGTVRTYFS